MVLMTRKLAQMKLHFSPLFDECLCPKCPKMLLNSDSNAKSLLNMIYAQMIVLMANVCNFTQLFAFSRN